MPPRRRMRKRSRGRKGGRRGNKMFKKAFKKGVKNVVHSMMEHKFVNTDAVAALANGMHNYPAVYLERLDVPARIPVRGVSSAQYIGDEFDMIGFMINITVAVDPAAVKNASARLTIIQLKADHKQSVSEEGVGAQPPDGFYNTQARLQGSSFVGTASDLALFQADASAQKYTNQELERLPIWKEGQPVLPCWVVKKQYVLDTHRIEGTYTNYVKRMRVFVPCKRRIHRLTTDKITATDWLFKNPTYLMWDTVQWNLADSVTGTPAITGVNVLYNVRTIYRDL